MQNIVYFDLETQLSSEDVGGWKPEQMREMRMSVAVAYDSGTKEWHTFPENDVESLLALLANATLIVGFNIRRFDYTVLSRYVPASILQESPTFDMLNKIYATLGHRLSMENLAQANFGEGKSADGVQAVELWKEGNIDELKEYCKRDVELERNLFMKGCKEGYLYYTAKTGRLLQLRTTHWDKTVKEFFK